MITSYHTCVYVLTSLTSIVSSSWRINRKNLINNNLLRILYINFLCKQMSKDNSKICKFQPALIIYMFDVFQPKFFMVGRYIVGSFSFFFLHINNLINKIFFLAEKTKIKYLWINLWFFFEIWTHRSCNKNMQLIEACIRINTISEVSFMIVWSNQQSISTCMNDHGFLAMVYISE